MNKLSNFPAKDILLSTKSNGKVYNVNAHFHTPYSFSAFENISQVFTLANEENITVLGINDFFTTEGYEEFYGLCEKHKKFPLYSIEFMALQKDEQANGIRVNDPNNPGRTYFCGKGLNFPAQSGEKQQALLDQVMEFSTKQTIDMVDKLNAHLASVGVNIVLNFEAIKAAYCKNIVRERHIAKALRIEVYNKFNSDADRTATFGKIFGKEMKSGLDNIPALENEIRGNLLKAGGAAFVEEDPKAFLSLEEIIDIIIDAGGIPCYPTLLDDPNGNYTDYEGNFETLYQKLTAKNVWALELIPGRNKFEHLKKFVQFFNEKGFVITFGTEHNTPALDPLTISCSGGVALDEELKQIGYKGACVIAANQYLHAQGQEGYVNKNGQTRVEDKADFITLGKAVIEHYVA